jgi:hypothetical protein
LSNLSGAPLSFQLKNGAARWRALVAPDSYTMGFVNTSATLVPIGRGTVAVKSVVPQGLKVLNKLNAAQYSSLTKGTFLAKMSPKFRGVFNKSLNRGINMINENVGSGNAVFTGVKLTKSVTDKE